MAVNGLTSHLNSSLAPGGDLALTLTNVRKITGQASTMDVGQLNATVVQAKEAIAQMQALVKSNETQVNAMMVQGAAASEDTRALLENLSGSLVATTGNLERVTRALDALTQRLSDDPTYVLRGQKFKDPPPPGGGR